jgi:hypothetical protein
VLLVRLEADASLSSCYGSSLIMQLNVNSLPTLTQYLPSAQRDFSGTDRSITFFIINSYCLPILNHFESILGRPRLCGGGAGDGLRRADA